MRVGIVFTMSKSSKVSGGAVLSFFAALAICLTITGFTVVQASKRASPDVSWYARPENIILLVSAVLISLLVFLVFQNRANIKQMSAYFENMATTDTLTSVYNRKYIDENIDRLIKSISRSNGALTVMMVEIDRFGLYIETYGRGTGDNCLKTIANTLSQSLKRENDFVARYGAEEFTVILPNTNENGAHMLADRLLKNIRGCNIPHEKNDAANFVTISIGVTVGIADYSHNGDEFIKMANDALNISRQNGRNRYTLFNF